MVAGPGATVREAIAQSGLPWSAQSEGANPPSFDKQPVLAFGNDVFVIAGKIDNAAEAQICWSADGRLWTKATFPAGVPQVRGVTFGNGRFIAVGDGGTVLNSTDGKTWSLTTVGTAPNFRHITWDGASTWLAVAMNAAQSRPEVVWTSLDGATWSQHSSLGVDVFETFGAGLEALKAGDVDLTLSDSTAANGYVTASEGKLKIIGEPLASEDFGFIFPKGSDLVAPMNAATTCTTNASVIARFTSCGQGAAPCHTRCSDAPLKAWRNVVVELRVGLNVVNVVVNLLMLLDTFITGGRRLILYNALRGFRNTNDWLPPTVSTVFIKRCLQRAFVESAYGVVPVLLIRQRAV